MKTIILFLFIVFFSFPMQENIPQEVDDIAKKGNKVYLYSHDDNAVVHAQNALESWGYWKIAKTEKEADFILKFYLITTCDF